MIIPALSTCPLPPEISSLIFDNLDAKTYPSMLLVCTSWSETILNYIVGHYSQHVTFVPRSYLPLVEPSSDQSMAKYVFITAKKITEQYNSSLKKEITISLKSSHLQLLIKETRCELRKQLIDAFVTNKKNQQLVTNKNKKIDQQQLANFDETNLALFFEKFSYLYLKDNIERVIHSQDLLLFSNLKMLFLNANTELQGQLDCATLTKFECLNLINIDPEKNEDRLVKTLKKFINTDKITCIILKGFSLQRIPPEIFSQFKKLRSLECDNAFTTFPYDAFSHEHLQHLTLHKGTPIPDPKTFEECFKRTYKVAISEPFFTIWIEKNPKKPSVKRKHPED